MPKVHCACISTVISVIFGVLLLIIGLVFLLFAFPRIFKDKINENLVLRNGTDEFKRWVDPPAPIYTTFYLFDVINAHNVNTWGDTPELQQLGPYVFREEKLKEVSYLDEDNGRVRYKERRTYHFEPSMTNGTLNDTINHVNVVSIVLANTFQKNHLSFLIPFIRGKYIESHTVDQLIFSGFSMKEYFPSFISYLCKLKDNCTFAFYLGKNGTTGKEFDISSGVVSMDDFTEIKRYAGLTSLQYWYGDTCNQLNGTDGQQFPPGVTENDNLYIFSEDVCRSINIQYEKRTTLEDIDALRFVVPASVFADPNKDKDNMCFCLKDNTTGKCPSKAGVISLATCQGGNPVLLSAPHFYQGEPEYWQRFPGLMPNKTLHESFLSVEPLTGTVIAAAKRLQINLLVVPNKLLVWLKEKNVTYFPVFWAEEGGQIDSDDAARFKNQVYGAYSLGKWSLVSATILGAIILFVVLIIFVIQKMIRKNHSYKGLLEEEVDHAGSTEKINEGEPSIST